MAENGNGGVTNVLIEVEGGIAQATSDKAGTNLVMLDWDSLRDESVSIGDLARVLVQVADLPSDARAQIGKRRREAVEELLGLIQKKA